MKKFLPKTSFNPLGFTLIELLIVITIIAVLATIGFAVYSSLNTGPRSRNASRRADIDSISKALELNKVDGGNYKVLADTQFSNGTIPKKDVKGNLYCGNTTADERPDTPTEVWTAACPAGFSAVSNLIPLAGTKWKICTWLEDEDGADAGVAKAFCKISAQ